MLVKTLYEEGEPFEKIVDISEGISVDLIVMGKKGMSALREIYLEALQREL